ncbi:unnamed protein product [Ectocarpus fasciculatus]
MFWSRRSTSCVLLLAAALLGIAPGSEGFLGAPQSAVAAGRSGAAGRRGCSRTTRARQGVGQVVVAADSGDGAATTAETGGDAESVSTTTTATSTCRNCKQQFNPDDNVDGSCSYHPGLFSGRLNRINDVDTSGLEYFWSCCGETDPSHPGCVKGKHASYDDPPEGGDGAWRSPLTGTLR